MTEENGLHDIDEDDDADVDTVQEVQEVVQEPYYSVSRLYQAAVDGDVEEVRRQIAGGVDVATTGGGFGETPLHAAVRGGFKLVMELLLTAQHPVNTYCEGYYTPLHLAVDRDNGDMAEELLRHGAMVNAQDSGDCTPLHYAAEKGFYAAARVLLRHGASVNARCHDMVTPLHFSVSMGKLEMMKLLLDAGADIEAGNRMRQRPLHLAALSGKLEMAIELVNRGADLTAVDFEGRTPLHFACEFGKPIMTTFLLEAGSDVNAVMEDNTTAIKLARRGREVLCVLALENHCAMLRAANFHVSSPHLGDGASADFRGVCKGEVDKMKATKGNDLGPSLYDVLVSDVERAAMLLRNEALRTLSTRGLTKNFPIYSPMIRRVVRKATKRIDFLDDAIYALEGLTHNRLPTEILREVTKYLRDEDLNSVITAYNRINSTDPKP